MKRNYYQVCSELGREIGHGLLDSWFDKECFEVIKFYGNNFLLGSALKYIWRLGEKSASIQSDLLKAKYYLKLYNSQYELWEKPGFIDMLQSRIDNKLRELENERP